MKLIIKMPKIARVITVVILSIIAFLSLVVFGVRAYFMAPINDYYSASAKSLRYRGLAIISFRKVLHTTQIKIGI